MKVILRTLIILIPIFFSSCFFLRIGIRSLGDTFSSPEEITNKITNPIRDDVKLSALRVGHSTVLIQMYDKVIVTDPFFTDKLGGLLLRKKEAGLEIKNIPHLDLILVSHSHMDHMSFASLDMLADRFPGCPMLFPKGNEQYLLNFDLNMIRVNTARYLKHEYEASPVFIDSMKITPVYAFHPGGRYLIDTYSWKIPGATGYIVQYKDLCIYFAGDTGYDEYAFKDIGKKFKIDLAMIPIGPCHNCDSVGIRYHASTVEALQIFEDLNADAMIPIHYGALTYFGDPDHPLNVLKNILSDTESGYYPLADKIKILDDGQQVVLIKK